MAKKKKSKKGGAKKGKKAAPTGPPPIPNYEGFNPIGIPLKVFKIDREKVIKGETLTPEQEELLAQRGDDPATQPAQYVRVGESLNAPVLDLKRRIWEMTSIPMGRMTLLFQASVESGGRPISELRGWNESWPWPKDLTVIQLADDLSLVAYDIAIKSGKRKDVERKEHEAFEAELAADPEKKKKYELQKMADKLARLDTAKKDKDRKKGKKSKKGNATKGKAPKMGEKELIIFEAKLAKEAEQKRIEKIQEQDRHRRWEENQFYLMIKPEGMADLNAFGSRPAQPKIETPKKDFKIPMPKPKPIENSFVKNEAQRAELGSPITMATLKSLHQLPPLVGQMRPQGMSPEKLNESILNLNLEA